MTHENPLTAIEKLLAPEVIAEVRDFLEEDWRSAERGQYRLRLADIWSPPNPLYPEYESMRAHDHKMLRLNKIPQKRGRRTPGIMEGSEYRFYNKATVFYLTQSANTTGYLRYLLAFVLSPILYSGKKLQFRHHS